MNPQETPPEQNEPVLQQDYQTTTPVSPVQYPRFIQPQPTTYRKWHIVIAVLVVIVGSLFAAALYFLAPTQNKEQQIHAKATTGKPIKLTPGQTYNVGTGGELCILQNGYGVLFDFEGECLFDTNNNDYDRHTRLPIDAGQQVAIHQKDKQHVIKVTKCSLHQESYDRSDTVFYSEGGPSDILDNCEVTIDSVKLDDPSVKPKKIVKQMIQSGSSLEARYYNDDPLIYKGEYTEGSPSGIGQLWKSTKCPNKKFCAYIIPEGVMNGNTTDGTEPVTFEYVTRKGLASFVYELEDVYNKKTKTISLTNATVTLTILDAYYKCHQYCDSDRETNNLSVQTQSTDPNGELFNEYLLELTYVEKGAE